jgi:hypothetical protein
MDLYVNGENLYKVSGRCTQEHHPKCLCILYRTTTNIQDVYVNKEICVRIQAKVRNYIF